MALNNFLTPENIIFIIIAAIALIAVVLVVIQWRKVKISEHDLAVLEKQIELKKITMVEKDMESKRLMETGIPYLYVLPSCKELLGLDIELAGVEKPQFFLKKALMAPELDFDYVFIDCPPAVGMLTINALTASDAVVVPIQCEYLALEGVADLIKTIERVKKNFNSNLDLHGILLTMFDGRSRLSYSVAEDVRRFFGEKVYKSFIPRNVRIPEAPSHGKPVLLYDYKCTGSQAYIRLAAEFLKREKELLKNG